MRHVLYLLVLLIALSALLPASAAASDYVCFHGSLISSMQGDGMHVQISLVWWAWANCWTSPVLVNVYRRELGMPCGPMVLLTNLPLLWPGLTQGGGPVVLGEVIDGDAVSGTAYEYVLRALDGNLDPIPGDDDVILGYVSDGDALINHGTLVSYPDCGISSVSGVNPCQDACFPSFNVGAYPSEVGTYFNTGTELLVYGHFDTEPAYLCNAWVPRVIITSATPSTCSVAVEKSTWGSVKSRYR